MPLHEMATHPRRGRDRPLQVDLSSFLQGAEIRPPQCLWRDADFEGGLVEFGDGEAGAVDADAVAEGGVGEDLAALGDGEGGAAAAGGGGVEVAELGDGWECGLVMRSKSSQAGMDGWTHCQ